MQVVPSTENGPLNLRLKPIQFKDGQHSTQGKGGVLSLKVYPTMLTHIIERNKRLTCVYNEEK